MNVEVYPNTRMCNCAGCGKPMISQVNICFNCTQLGESEMD